MSRLERRARPARQGIPHNRRWFPAGGPKGDADHEVDRQDGTVGRRSDRSHARPGAETVQRRDRDAYLQGGRQAAACYHGWGVPPSPSSTSAGACALVHRFLRRRWRWRGGLRCSRHQSGPRRTDMTWIISAQERLREANGLAAVLDAAYDAFEGMLPVIRVGQDNAGSLFAAFGKSAASAADGRNAILLAPSLPPHCLHRTPAPGEGSHRGEGAESIAVCLAALSQLLTDRLAQAAKSAPDYRDRAACRSAARRARDIHALLTGPGCDQPGREHPDSPAPSHGRCGPAPSWRTSWPSPVQDP